MLRDITISLVFLAFSSAAHAEAPVSELTGKTVIDGDSVTVGDLFTNTGENADFVLAPAPTQQKPLVLTKKDLKRVADHFNLTWEAPKENTSVILHAALDEANTIMVPVLSSAKAPTGPIAEEDLVEVPMARDAVRATTILKKSDLVGLVPKRTLMANQPLMVTDVTLPLMIKRNELVTVTYKNGVINLTTKARAVANASKGELVTLENLTSKKPFQAVVSGPAQAEIVVEQTNS